jgi:hypothetical protein
MIDLGDPEAPEIVEVPEADAPQRRGRERVRKPAAAVLAGVATATVEASDPDGEPEPTPEDQQNTDESPKRRGWWSRALGGS